MRHQVLRGVYSGGDIDWLNLTPGAFVEGGDFVGLISHSANGVPTHALIKAPRSSVGFEQVNQWKLSHTDDPAEYPNLTYDGLVNTEYALSNFNLAEYPVFDYINSNRTINGYSDWYLPGIHELDIAYTNLKPTTDLNHENHTNALLYTNPYSIPPRAANRLPAGPPVQTPLTDFQDSNSRSIYTDNFNHNFWTSNPRGSSFVESFAPSTGQNGVLFKLGGAYKEYLLLFRQVPLPLQQLVATGGDSVYTITDGGTDYKVHEFLSTGSNNFVVTDAGLTGEVEFLVIGGGGGGGGDLSFSNAGGGGGGAGGFVEGTTTISVGSYPIVVGAGGAGSNTRGAAADNGGDSTAFGIVALGGGGGVSSSGTNAVPPGDGGSGGGGRPSQSGIGIGLQPGSASGGFGNDGGLGTTDNPGSPGGGGGGAGGAGGSPTVGTVGGPGGAGRASSITGSSTFYAGGGGGGGSGSGSSGAGGVGGGGNGASNEGADGVGTAPQNGTPNTGGGGGAGGSAFIGANGGSGVVIIRYPIST